MSRAKTGKAATGNEARSQKKRSPKWITSVFCPVCGLGHSCGIAEGIRGTPANYWQDVTKRWQDRPFGLMQDVSGGRGRGFDVIGDVSPLEVPAAHDMVKRRLLEAIAYWKSNGWITEAEIIEAMNGMNAEHSEIYDYTDSTPKERYKMKLSTRRGGTPYSEIVMVTAIGKHVVGKMPNPYGVTPAYGVYTREGVLVKGGFDRHKDAKNYASKLPR